MSKDIYLFPYYGGKSGLADWIISQFPSNYTKLHYVEPFSGSLVVFFKKQASHISTINDLNKNIFHFYLNLRDNPKELINQIKNTTYSEAEYKYAQKLFFKTKELSSIKRAWATYIVFNMSFAGNGSSGFKYTRKESHFRNEPMLFINRQKSLNYLSKVFKRVQIFNRNALTLIDDFKDNTNALMYLDPPYPEAVQDYSCKFTTKEFNTMLDTLYTAKFKWLLSFYERDSMNLDQFRQNKRFKFAYKNTHCTININDKNSSKRTECLLLNYADSPEQPALI